VRWRVIGVTNMILGVLVLLFAPAPLGVAGCSEVTRDGATPGCYEATFSLSGLITWPGGFDKVGVPMMLIGVVLLASGVVMVFKATRSANSAGTAR
jgi:hypothetical protein